MDREIRVLFSAFTCLLVLTVGGRLLLVSGTDCRDDLYAKLDDNSLSVGEIQAILERVKEPENAKIGRGSVAKLLELRSTACKLEGLTKEFFSEPRGYICDYNLNVGVQLFIKTQISKRKESCAELIHSELMKTVKKFGYEDKRIVEELYPKWIFLSRISWADKVDSLVKKIVVGPSLIDVMDERFAACSRLIPKLSEVLVLSKGWHNSIDLGDEFINDWTNILQTCKVYSSSRCTDVLSRTSSLRACDEKNSSDYFCLHAPRDELFAQETVCKSVETFLYQ